TAGVSWQGSEGGSSSWSNVDLVGLGATSGITAGWSDSNCPTQTTRSVHYFHGSRIRAMSDPSSNPSYWVGFFTQCAESWIFGGEILLSANRGSVHDDYVVLNGGGFMEVFGSAIRGKVTGSHIASDLVGVLVSSSGSALPVAFHSHGANIGLSTKDAASAAIN